MGYFRGLFWAISTFFDVRGPLLSLSLVFGDISLYWSKQSITLSAYKKFDFSFSTYSLATTPNVSSAFLWSLCIIPMLSLTTTQFSVPKHGNVVTELQCCSAFTVKSDPTALRIFPPTSWNRDVGVAESGIFRILFRATFLCPATATDRRIIVSACNNCFTFSPW